jgi:diguanylate cyclase (GGDEF)-like protein
MADETVTNSVHSAADPLSGLPSILALRDLHRRRTVSQPTASDDAHRRTMLRLDPPLAMRALRMAAAPVFGAHQDAWTLARIADALGPSLLERACDTPLVDVVGTAPLRQLWLHALATAHAAERLAAASGVMPPDEAYLLGLLHDAPTWTHWIALRQNGAPLATKPQKRPVATLPPAIATVLERAADLYRRGAAATDAGPAGLLAAAELLAEAAGFLHPGQDAAALVDSAPLLLDAAAAEAVRQAVENDLRDIGLDLDVDEPELPLGTPAKPEQAAHARPSIEAAHLVLSVLGDEDPACRGRSVVTAAMAAATRSLGFDRACYGTLTNNRATFVFRGKHDGTERPFALSCIAPNASELQALNQALQQNRPIRVGLDAVAQPGLLHALGALELIAVPVNRRTATPTFLLLDRTLSARPLQLLRESELIATLAVSTAMRMQNLLLQRRCKRAQKFALTDPLTRLFNRRMGITSLDQAIARSQRSGVDLTVLMIDLDQFKKLNDTYGHVQGDQALRATADVLRKTLRRSDTICRYGGEEFMVVLPETSAEESAVLAARLFTAVEARGHDERLPITVSIGQASVRQDDSAESLLNRADQALYASKAGGRNRFSIADEE